MVALSLSLSPSLSLFVSLYSQVVLFPPARYILYYDTVYMFDCVRALGCCCLGILFRISRVNDSYCNELDKD